MSTSPKLNIDLLEEVYDHIEAHPEQWDQGTWALEAPCGTSMCFAGTTVFLKGFNLLFEGPDEDRYREALYCKKPHGKRWDISNKAQQLLGLTEVERAVLFLDVSTDINDLRNTIDLIKEGQWRR